MQFNYGSEKIIDFASFLGKGISRDLLDDNYFRKVEIESGGGLSWPNGFDFCQNFLHDYENVADRIGQVIH